jgi:hypothetical protein
MKKDKLKTGPKPKATCSNGHDISVVGRTKAGNCKQCQSEYYKARWDFVRKNFEQKPS